MPYGYNGKILRVNLSSGAIDVEEHDETFYRTYFGGTNFSGYFLLKELKPGIDPLGPENKILFSAGPLTGAPLAGSGRNGVGGKSPLTGAFGDTQVGGYFGAELKHAGYDAIIVEGRAEKPVYLHIVNGKAEIRDASAVWGKSTAETETAIREETDEKLLRFAAIGPAGENLVRYACIVNDCRHAAGRTGMGAVMGSKNLKAIAARGKGGPPMAEPEKVRELAKWYVDNWKDFQMGSFDLGTPGGLRGLHHSGGLPTHNFKYGQFAGYEKIAGDTMRDSILTGRNSCYACPVHCKREVEVKEGPFASDRTYGGPEYETLGAFGSCCGVDDLAAVAKANWLCNANSLDTISTGAAIAFAMECFENGLLSERDTDGLRLTFGNAEAMVALIEMIAQRRGVGDLLAEGVKRAAEKIGGRAHEYALHVKGQELPMHEPRLKPAMGIGYAVSPTGADHMHNVHDSDFATPGGATDRLKLYGLLDVLPAAELSERKARLLYYQGTWQHAVNSLVMCTFLRWGPARMPEVIKAVTGWDTSLFELFKLGERAAILGRIFNLREGFTSKDDTLPNRMFEKFESGPLADVGTDKDSFQQAMVSFYEMSGWTADGIPTNGKLAELNVGWAAMELPDR